MNIIYQTYVDHHQEIKFPLEFLLKRHPELIIYTSDSENAIHCANLNTDIRRGPNPLVIGQKINRPEDIATAQNKCVNYTLNAFNPDYIVHVQADVYISSGAQKIIDEFCNTDNLDNSMHLKMQHVRLGLIVDRTYFGATVIGKNCGDRFIADGAYLNRHNIIGDHETSTAYDIGYLTIDQYRNHIRRHAVTWNSDIKPDKMSPSDIAVHAYKTHSGAFEQFGRQWFDSIAEFDYVVDNMGIRDEYFNTKRVMEDYLSNLRHSNG